MISQGLKNPCIYEGVWNSSMNRSDLNRNAGMLRGSLSRKGYMRWWHSFRAIHPETGEHRTFFIEYFIINPSLGGTSPILGQIPFHKKRKIKPSYVMIKAGAFGTPSGLKAKQLHNFYPIAALKAASRPFVLQVANNFCRENHICGSVDVSHEEARHKYYMSDEGTLEWNVEACKDIACHTGPIGNAFFTALNALDTFWHGEGIKTHYRGTVTLDGLTYHVVPETCNGYADKHWGKSFNKPWFQFATSHLFSEVTQKNAKHTSLAIDGCCPKFLCFSLKRKLIMQLTYEGEDFEFNFSRFRLFNRTKWKVKETNTRIIWQLVAQNKNAIVKVTGSCLKEEMLLMNYESPDGSRPQNPLYAGGTGIGKVLLYRRFFDGKQLEDTLVANDCFCEYSK